MNVIGKFHVIDLKLNQRMNGPLIADNEEIYSCIMNLYPSINMH